jgi:transposase
MSHSILATQGFNKSIMIQTNQFTQKQLLGRYLTEFQRQLLAKNLKVETIPEYRQRIEIMLLADEGKTQTQICRALSCSPLTARHWIFMARSGQAHNWQDQPIGRPKTVTSDYLERLKQLITANPRDLGYPFSRWTGQWLSKHLSQEFNIEVTARHINRLIEKMNDGAKVVDQIVGVGGASAFAETVPFRRNAAQTENQPQQQVGKSHQLVIADLYDVNGAANIRPQSK